MWRKNVRKGSPMFGRRLMERLNHELKFSDEQLEEIKPSFDEFSRKMFDLDKRVHPQKRNNLLELMQKIKQVLTPRQLEKMKRIEEHHRSKALNGRGKHDEVRRKRRPCCEGSMAPKRLPGEQPPLEKPPKPELY